MAETLNNLKVARLDPTFVTQLETLKYQARRVYESAIGVDQRLWQIPAPITWDNDLFHISTGPLSIAGAYDRTVPNQLYLRALNKSGSPLTEPLLTRAPFGEGRLSDCQAEKIQIDNLALQERAFRSRHMTSIRARLHASARRRGHSDINDRDVTPGETGPVGGIFTTLVRYVLITLESGYNDGAVPVVSDQTTYVTDGDGTVRATVV